MASFALFGIGAVVLGTLFFGALLLFMPRRPARQRLARDGVRIGFKLLLRFMARLGVLDLDIDREGLARLAGEGGSVIVANHPTLVDVVVLLAYIEQAGCVVKHSLWRSPFMSPAIRAAGYIPSRDPEQLLRDCDAALKGGESLIVFPEATRSVPGEPLRLHRGAASIALNSDAVLRVVHLRCEPVFLSKGDPWYHVPERRPCLAARVGASVRARELQRGAATRNVAARRLTEALQGELSKEIQLDARAGAGAQTAAN
jgi:1-acyl-sn-glycerol-3-phosphate acyltransferase